MCEDTGYNATLRYTRTHCSDYPNFVHRLNSSLSCLQFGGHVPMSRSAMRTAAVRGMIGTLFSASLLPLPCVPARADSPAANVDAAKLHALFDQEWQWTLREYPEFATGVGDDRYNDKL